MSAVQVANLVQVVSPGALCAAVSETQPLLVVGHKTVKGTNLSIFTLDASGTPSGVPTAEVALPTSPALQAINRYPLSMAFHPQLPLLYVWQDIDGPADTGDPAKNPVYNEFDHLLIFSVRADGALQLVQSAARGPQFAYKKLNGAILVDAINQRIFLPNLQDKSIPNPNATAAAGFYRLDVQGMPAKIPGQTVLTPKMVAPLVVNAGIGFAAASKDAVVFGVHGGPTVWEFENRRVNASNYYLHNIALCGVTSNPRYPYVYMVGINTGYLFSMEHVDGFLTLLPQLASLPTVLTSLPVVMSKQGKVAVGAVNTVYALKLDANGRLTPEMEQTALTNPTVKAMAYSEKLDRLYVPVEALK
ncbi:MAG: hypothetical protein ABI443_14440 [Chthoniobacterales bacterium]